MPIVALSSQKIQRNKCFFPREARRHTVLSISKMAGPLSAAAATAHWVPLAFRSHSNSQQTDLASMADHVQRTTQLVNFFSFFKIKLIIFRKGGSFCYLSECFTESASARPGLPPSPIHTAFLGELLLYISGFHCEIEEAKLCLRLSRLIICKSPERH